MAGESMNPVRRGATRTRASRTPSRPPKAKRTAPRARAAAKWVYLLSEGDATMKALLGGKGANLAEMTRLGLPVPPGFVVTTAACNAFLAPAAVPPDGLWTQVRAALARLERATGKRFGDPAQPAAGVVPLRREVLDARHDGHRAEHRPERRGRRRPRRAHRRPALRVRRVPAPRADVRHRGAGRARRAVRGRARAVSRAARRRQRRGARRRRPEGDHREFKARRRASTRKRPFPDEPSSSSSWPIEAVFRSWNGKRAFDYRNAAGIAHDLGTAVNIVSHGVRQPGRGLGHRRRDDAQRHRPARRRSKATC